MSSKGLVDFRVFFADGSTLDVEAPNPAIARGAAKEKQPDGIITKVKIMKGEDV
ncbi:MAG: hypothetical protein ACK4GT_00300 [Pararhodobacter sp.]